MTNIVIYARYSSQAQTEQSIEGQLRVCHEYAERNGFNVIHEYIDRAMTGTNDNRPEFQKMITDSSKKSFKYILVYKLDRFSRSKYDNAIYKHKLQQNDVKVISATEIISDTPEGKLMEGLLEMFAEMYSKDLSQKVKRGIRENILKGYTIGGKPLYGYKIENKKIVINEEQATAVKLIFNEYANGTPKKEIVEKLNNLGYRTNKGTKFKLSSLQQNILSNRKYLGEYKNEYIESNNYFPQIIDIDTFNKVQEKLKQNKIYSSRPKEQFILAGKVYCGYCGEKMIGTSGTSRTKESYPYYTCYNKNKNHNCNKTNEPKKKLEGKVFFKIYKNVLNDKMIEEIANNIEKEYQKDTNEKTINEYKKKIDKIEKEFANITQLMIKAKNDKIINELNNKANDLEEEQKTYQNEVDKLRLITQIKHTKEDILNLLKIYLNGDPNDINFRIKLIDIFVNSIYIFDNYFNIYFNLFNKQEKINFDKAEKHEKEAEKVFAHQTDCPTMTFNARTYLDNYIFYENVVGIIIKKD